MDHKNTSRAIMAFVVLSVIVHGIIAYVIVKTNNDEQIIEPIELVDQNELNRKPEYQKPPAQKKQVARKKPRVKKQRVETPRVETSDVETSKVESEALSQKKAEEKEVLSGLPDAPLNTESSNDESTVSVSDENSEVVIDAAEDIASQTGTSSQKKEGVVEDSAGDGQKSGASGSDSVAIQELKTVTELAEQPTGEAQAADKSNVASKEKSTSTSSDAVSVKKAQVSKSTKDGPIYRVNQVSVIRPTSFKYPQVSRRLKEEGTATLRLFFDKSGSPQKVELLKSTGSTRLDDAARQGASTLRLKSLGHAFIYELPVRFQLDFTDQQLNESIDFLAPKTSDGLGKFKSKAQSR